MARKVDFFNKPEHLLASYNGRCLEEGSELGIILTFKEFIVWWGELAFDTQSPTIHNDRLALPSPLPDSLYLLRLQFNLSLQFDLRRMSCAASVSSECLQIYFLVKRGTCSFENN